MGRDLPRPDADEGPAVVHTTADGELVLRTGGEDPCVSRATEGVESEEQVEIAVAPAAVLYQGDSEYRQRSAPEGH